MFTCTHQSIASEMEGSLTLWDKQGRRRCSDWESNMTPPNRTIENNQTCLDLEHMEFRLCVHFLLVLSARLSTHELLNMYKFYSNFDVDDVHIILSTSYVKVKC